MARRAQVAEGAELGVVLHHGLVQDAVGPEPHAVAEAARAHAGARTHDALGADHGAPLERDAGIEDGVGADLDGVVDIGARGIEHGDAVGHQPVQDAPAHDRGHCGELLSVVHAEALAGVLGDHRVEMVPALPEDLDHVGQVVLALGVLGGDARQGRPEAAVEAVRAGADLADGALLGRGVAMLHDGHRHAALADHPAVAGGIVELGGEEGRRRARLPVSLDEAAERRLGQRAACRRAGPGWRRCRRHRPPGPGAPRGRCPRRSRCSTKVASASRLTAARTSSAPRPTTTITRAPRARATLDRIVDERPTAELVKRLGTPGAHAGRLAGSENDRGELVHGGQTSSTRHARACPRPPVRNGAHLGTCPAHSSSRRDCEDDTGPPQFCREEETKTSQGSPVAGWTKARPAAWSATPPSPDTRARRSGSAWRSRARPA